MIIEGKAKISVPKSDKLSKKMPVFYNPIMAFNRDLSIRLINALGKKDLRVGLPLAGTGIRGIRLSLETDAIEEIYYNDLNETASKLIEKNLEENGIKGTVSTKHASLFLLMSKGFDYIDIDPFGSPVPYVDASIKRLARNSILAITATDTAPLCGTYPKACQRKYWARPLRQDVMHEVALRILIRRIQLIGAQYERALIPILSYSKDHYLRVFFICKKGKSLADEVLSMHSYLQYCPKCLKRSFTKESISECHSKAHNAGPMWSGSLNDQEVLEKLDDRGLTVENYNFLRILREESSLDDGNIFIDIHNLYKKFVIGNVKKTDHIIELLKKEGFKASRSHFCQYGMRTDASVEEIIRVLS